MIAKRWMLGSAIALVIAAAAYAGSQLPRGGYRTSSSFWGRTGTSGMGQAGYNQNGSWHDSTGAGYTFSWNADSQKYNIFCHGKAAPGTTWAGTVEFTNLNGNYKYVWKTPASATADEGTFSTIP